VLGIKRLPFARLRYYYWQETQKEPHMAGLAIGSPAPDFTLDDCNGNTVSLSQLKGKKVLLYFFTSPGGGN
jgi:cytochrome oxidase Cu insertion factor (SCO1/SenC/PrrC family)